MTSEISKELQLICDTAPPRLRALTESELSFEPAPGKWSKKETLGHLIDSAANNHQRFVRTQFEISTIYYDQDLWVSVQQYQAADSDTVIALWEMYNRHLAFVIQSIPMEKLSNISIGKDGKAHTLQFLIEDYLAHLEHHLKDILS